MNHLTLLLMGSLTALSPLVSVVSAGLVEPGPPFKILDYQTDGDASPDTFRFHLKAGDYQVAIRNEGPNSTEATIQRPGFSPSTAEVAVFAFRGARMDADGMLEVTLDGEGRFAVVDGSLTDELMSGTVARKVVAGPAALGVIALGEEVRVCIWSAPKTSIVVTNDWLIPVQESTSGFLEYLVPKLDTGLIFLGQPEPGSIESWVLALRGASDCTGQPRVDASDSEQTGRAPALGIVGAIFASVTAVGCRFRRKGEI